MIDGGSRDANGYSKTLLKSAAFALSLMLSIYTEAKAADIDQFVGQFVGVAEVIDDRGDVLEQRHMDIEIDIYKRDGLKIDWYNVTLVDGRRDVAGVVRKTNEVVLVPHEDRNFFVEAAQNSPFREKSKASPQKGDPVRWAVVEDSSIHFYSFQKLPDGRYELQHYERSLTETGLELIFERSVDDVVRRQIIGRAVRALQ